MPVIIENFSPKGRADNEPHSYRVRVNTDLICRFKHVRAEGLAACLRRAADAVDAAGQGRDWMRDQEVER